MDQINPFEKGFRPNYSRYGQICDRMFYIDNDNYDTSLSQSLEFRKIIHKDNNTTAFTSVSRNKRGNFRFPIRLPHGQFTHHPNHLYGRNKSPSWSLSKAEKYVKEIPQDYEVCQKNYMITKRITPKSTQQPAKDIYKVRLNKSSSAVSTADQRTTKNYSIIDPRQTSPVGFFKTTKINDPFYLTKEALMEVEDKIQKNLEHQKEPCPKGYIEFYKKKTRQPNNNSKQFQTLLKNYNHQKQFQNFQLTKYPISPNYHINFDKHLDRPQLFDSNKCGPNPIVPKFDITRINKSKADYNLSKFRTKVKTRYDRIEDYPNTRLSYDLPQSKTDYLVKMEKVIPRNPQLFPTIDPFIKIEGYDQMKLDIQSYVKPVQINEALSHRHYQYQ